ncbi:MAG: hypothetical protein U0V70_21570 [Terriglobia bacterium]
MKFRHKTFALKCLAVVVIGASAQHKMIFALSPQQAGGRPKPSPAAPPSSDVVPAQFFGDYVPATGTCDSPVRFQVEGTKVTLINGKDSATFGDLAIPTSYFGPDYSGISTVLVPEINGNDPPFNVYFNYNEKKGVTWVDIYTPGPASPHAVLAAMQTAHKKLAERFPLNQMPLKKCAPGNRTVGAAPGPTGAPKAPVSAGQKK